MDNKDLKYPTDNVDDDIDLYLRLLKYGTGFTFKSKWYDRTNLYIPRQDEDSFVKRCRDKMLAVGLLRIKEKAPATHLEDILELSLWGDEIQKTGWKKYLEQADRKEFNWDKFLNKANLIVTIILGILTAISIVYSLGTGRETEQLKQEVDSLKSEVRKQNSILIPVDTASRNPKPDSTTRGQK